MTEARAELHLVDAQDYVVSREHLLELELHAERVRRVQAELELAKTQQAAAAARVSAVYTDGGTFELLGPVDGATGVGRRRRRPTDGGSHG